MKNKKEKESAPYFSIKCVAGNDQVYLEADGSMRDIIDLFANAIEMSPEIGKLMQIAINIQNGTIKDTDVFNLSNN